MSKGKRVLAARAFFEAYAFATRMTASSTSRQQAAIMHSTKSSSSAQSTRFGLSNRQPTLCLGPGCCFGGLRACLSCCGSSWSGRGKHGLARKLVATERTPVSFHRPWNLFSCHGLTCEDIPV